MAGSLAFILINSILVLSGMAVMSLAIVRGKRLQTKLSASEFKGRWGHLLLLMRFFVLGYGLALFLVVTGRFELLSTLTAVIFAAGALFVSISMSVSVDVGSALLAEISTLKSIQLDRKRDEEQFHAFFDIANVGFSQADPKTHRFLVVNAKMEEITGYSRSELLQMGFPDVTHPEDRERDLEAYGKLIDGVLPVYASEKRYLRKDGKIIWVSVNGVIARDRFGEDARTISIVQDITELKKAQEEREKLLRETTLRRELLETLVENSPIGVILLSAPDMVVEMLKAPNRAPAPFKVEVGQSLFENMPPQIVAEARPLYEQLIRTGEPVIDTDRLFQQKSSDGLLEDHYFTMVRIRVKLPDGRDGVMSFYSETTDRVLLQRELEMRVAARTSELRKAYTFVNAVLENIPDALFIKEAKELRVTRVNKSWEKLFGHSHADIIGKNDFDLFTKEEAELFIRKDREVLASAQLLDISEESVHTQSQGVRVLHTKKVPIFDEQGRAEYLLGISEDITVRKQAEEVRQELVYEKLARGESERALHLRDEFISIAAHELKTPLTALKIQVQLLKRFFPETDTPGSGKFLKLVLDSQDNVDRFAKLVDDLLDVSRVSAGRLVVEKTEDDLVETVRRVAARYQAELERSKCLLQLDLPDSLVGLWDPSRIEQLLVNLLSNAMKYGAGKPVEISITRVGASALIRVRDHGIGIAKEDQARIFDRFERAVSMKKFGGLGLGLFIAQQISAAHGGTLRVESELDQGSCFIVELPLGNQMIKGAA